jgi:hypothetical protein
MLYRSKAQLEDDLVRVARAFASAVRVCYTPSINISGQREKAEHLFRLSSQRRMIYGSSLYIVL